MKKYLLIFMIGLLAGCSESENEDAKYWSYGFTSPPYYEMLIEHVTAVMPNKDEYTMMTGGGTGGFHYEQNPGEITVNSRGYEFYPRGGSYMQKYRLTEPPMGFVVGWFSVAENQFYAALVNIDESARKKMQTPYKKDCWKVKKITYMNEVLIGLAPGGYVRAWLKGSCREPVEIGHFRGWKMDSALYSGNTYDVYKDHVKQSREDFKKEWSIPFPYEKWK